MSDLSHGNILVGDGDFHLIGRYDEHDYPLDQVRLIRIPLGTRAGSCVRDMDENLLQAAIDAGAMLVIDRENFAEFMTHPDLVQHFERLPHLWRSFLRLPRTKPTIRDLQSQGLVMKGAELERRMARGKDCRVEPRT